MWVVECSWVGLDIQVSKSVAWNCVNNWGSELTCGKGWDGGGGGGLPLR